jgi:hypothetical protein
MPNTSRWICKSTQGYAIDGVKKTLKALQDEKYRTYEGTENAELRYTVNLHEDVARQDWKYIYGTFYFEYEQGGTTYKFTDTGAVDAEDTVTIDTDGVDFWISNATHVLFSKSKKDATNISARELLSSALFGERDKINHISFDIAKIESDYLASNSSALWTCGVKRRGKITSAIFWGDDISSDDMYGYAKKAKRKSIGVKVKIGERIVKIRISKDGTITACTGFGEPLNASQLFDVVEKFTQYQT